MTIAKPVAKAIPRHPAFDMLSRYRAILSAAWTHPGPSWQAPGAWPMKPPFCPQP